MTTEEKIIQLKVRIQRLESRGDINLKMPGVLKKLRRKLYKLESMN